MLNTKCVYLNCLLQFTLYCGCYRATIHIHNHIVITNHWAEILHGIKLRLSIYSDLKTQRVFKIRLPILAWLLLVQMVKPLACI